MDIRLGFDEATPPSFERDVFRFNSTLRQLKKPAECQALFLSAIAPFGFDTFACGEIDLRDRDRNVFYIVAWPPSWTKFYIDSGMINRDPILDQLPKYPAPFTWTDLRTDRKLPKVGREALDLIAEAGWSEGLVVPLPSSGNRIGLVSLVGNRLITDDSTRAYLTLLSICLHSHVRTRVAQEGFAMPPMGLTPREIECVQLVARGFSDASISRELKIAASTAHEFVEKAKRRLKTKSRAEMIAVAASLGIIDI